jgi:hypothetical protein
MMPGDPGKRRIMKGEPVDPGDLVLSLGDGG